MLQSGDRFCDWNVLPGTKISNPVGWLDNNAIHNKDTLSHCSGETTPVATPVDFFPTPVDIFPRILTPVNIFPYIPTPVDLHQKYFNPVKIDFSTPTPVKISKNTLTRCKNVLHMDKK